MSIENFLRILESLEINPLKLSGKTTLKGTRIGLYMVLSHIEAGWSIREMVNAYPTLSDKLEVLELIENNLQKVKCIHSLLKKLRLRIRYIDGIPYIKLSRKYIKIDNIDKELLQDILREEAKCLSEEEISVFAKSLPKIVRPLNQIELEEYNLLKKLKKESLETIKEKRKKALAVQ
ncbi:MAG: DUF433 domain-containing protein [Candidatus Njordarchaeota archaeon]